MTKEQGIAEIIEALGGTAPPGIASIGYFLHTLAGIVADHAERPIATVEGEQLTLSR